MIVMTAAHEDGLSVLDPRFPIRCDQPPAFFWELVHGWDDRDTIITLTGRATSQDAVAQERFIQRVTDETMPATMRAIEAPIRTEYPQLAPAELAHENGPPTAVWDQADFWDEDRSA